MGDGHHKILLLLVRPELSSNGTVNKNSTEENENKEGRPFTHIFGIVAHSLVGNFFLLRRIFSRIRGNGGLQVFHAKPVHGFVLRIKGKEPPYQGGNDIGKKYPVNNGGES